MAPDRPVFFAVAAAALTATATATTLLNDPPCVDAWTVQITGKAGCSLDSFLTASEAQGTFGADGCDALNTTAMDELRAIFDVSTEEEVRTNFEAACAAAYADEKTFAFGGVTGRGPAFDKEYYDGGTYYNEERQDLDEHGVRSYQLNVDPGARIGNVYDQFAKYRKMEFPGWGGSEEPLSNFKCSINAVMCCFAQDRQANDNNGDCATPYPQNCADANPADNTDVCYADMSDAGDSTPFGASGGNNGFAVYEDNAEEDSHCHGFAWSNDERHDSHRFRGNNAFYVSMYDHLRQRGYVRNVPGAPMCGCVEKMPVVTRSDCTQVDLQSEKLTFSYSAASGSEEGIKVTVSDVQLKFNACQGFNGQNNDLRAYYRRLVEEDEVPTWKFEKFKKRVVLPGNCPKAISSFLDARGYEPVPGAVISSHAHGRRPFAQAGKSYESGFGAANSGQVYDDQKWQFRPLPYGWCYGHDACYEIVNARSLRRMYAQGGKTGTDGVGAAPGNIPHYADQRWRLERSDCDGTACYSIVNVSSNRRLKAFPNWDRLAAPPAADESHFHDSRFLITGVPYELESTPAATPAPTSAPTGAPTMAVPGHLLDVPIVNFHNGRRLYAMVGKDWESGVGAGHWQSEDLYADNYWTFRPRECPNDTDKDGSGCYLIVNSASNRRLYAQAGKEWEVGLGAARGDGPVYQDNHWQLVEVNCEGDINATSSAQSTCYYIRNAISDRYLYANAEGQWESGVGATPAGSLEGPSKKWMFEL